VRVPIAPDEASGVEDKSRADGGIGFRLLPQSERRNEMGEVVEVPLEILRARHIDQIIDAVLTFQNDRADLHRFAVELALDRRLKGWSFLHFKPTLFP
jgi:hypothetical protein